MEGTSGGGGGGMGNGGGGLARFRSAPVTWLDALLEEDLTREAASSSGGGLTQLLTATPPAAADPGFFQRQNSSPADFATPDAYFSSFPVSGNYDFLAPSHHAQNLSISPNKRSRDTDSSSDLPSPSDFHHHHHHLKGEPSSLLDLEMDKLLEDSVPCRLRAKRGCATHPRSIAERVRRTRISDRIRKLQELVPNMDKQTNTADMLEEAVEYVKRLQEQIEELTELQKNCTCMAKE